MKTQLIVLRGNSGCGKTRLAAEIRNRSSKHVMVISQDAVRIAMCDVKDTDGNMSIGLLELITDYGYGKADVIILEGILPAKKYKAMLQRLQRRFIGHVLFVYLDVPFEKTVERYYQKENPGFSVEMMKAWWLEHDILDVDQELILDNRVSLDEMIRTLLDTVEDPQYFQGND